jgi:hypothetical protein
MVNKKMIKKSLCTVDNKTKIFIMENNLLDIAKQIVQDGFGKPDLSVIDNNIQDDFIEHQFGMQGGKEGLKKAIQSLHVAFPDMHYRVINNCINEDTVWIHFQ